MFLGNILDFDGFLNKIEKLTYSNWHSYVLSPT